MRFIILATFAVLGVALGDEQCSGPARKENIYENPLQRLFDQEFGMALTPEDFLTSMNSFMSPFSVFHDYFRPWRHAATLNRDMGSSISTEKNHFQINLDVQHFAPEEITVKTADGYVVIEAKHEEKKDEHGFVSRQFARRYALPEGVEADSVVSQLSSDGVLTVSAPLKTPEKQGERAVPISPTGPVRKQAKEQACQGETCGKK